MTHSNFTLSSAPLGDLCAFAVHSSLSLNRRIPNGSWCLFREPSDGSRNGKVVIVQSRDIQDPDTGGQYTAKIYRSEKAVVEIRGLIKVSASNRVRWILTPNHSTFSPTQ